MFVQAAIVEIDLILKGIKTARCLKCDPFKDRAVEIDLILKGIKTDQPSGFLPDSTALGRNRPDSQRD